MRIGSLGSVLMGGKLGTIFARAGHDVACSHARGHAKIEEFAAAPARTRVPDRVSSRGEPESARQVTSLPAARKSRARPDAEVSNQGCSTIEAALPGPTG